MVAVESPQLVDQIPDPGSVRERLGEALREVELLRRILRLSEHAAKYRREGQDQEDRAATP